MAHLSKSKFVAGLQCEKRLWWEVHEPDAPELRPDEGQRFVLDRGTRVGELARRRFPGGVLVDVPFERLTERVRRTREALAAKSPAIFEASFFEDGVFVSVDVLERTPRGHVLTEVKSSLDVKAQHFPDVAIQLHVLRQAGVNIRRAEVMHLNRACRAPRLGNLFVRENVTKAAEAAVPRPAREVKRLLKVLDGPLPQVETGLHCEEPYPCPFVERCWPPQPEHHVSTLANIRRAKVEKLVEAGFQTLHDLPEDYPAAGAAARQITAVRSGRMVVEPGLGSALAEIEEPVAYLDFETINLAVPVWRGTSPYQQLPVQFSVHVGSEGKAMRHHEFLAAGPADPRPALAEALVAACKGAKTILAYHAQFERDRLRELAKALPDRRAELRSIVDRLVDLKAIVRNHVYHPKFFGQFGLKNVLPVLVKGLDYGDLEIREGNSAAAALEQMLFEEGFPEHERTNLRRAMLAYCERDTLALVRLHERLVALGRSGS